VPDSVDPWTAKNSPWNPSEDPLNVWGKGSWTPTPSDPFAPVVPQPASIPMGRRMPADQVIPFLKGAASRDFLLNLVFVGVLWELWICLYPLSTLAGLFTFVYAAPVMQRIMPRSSFFAPGLYAVGALLALCLFVIWTVSRYEHVFANNIVYRAARHVVRILLLGLATVVLIEQWHGVPYNIQWPMVSRILKMPQYLAMVIAAMVAAHFALWNWKWGREFWHRRLVAARLRKFA